MMVGSRLRRKRSALTLFALAITLVLTATFWLAETGTITFPAQPRVVVGDGPGGSTTTFTPLTPSTVSLPQGQGAQVISGMLLGKVVVSAGLAPRVKVDFAWLNPSAVGAVLNNPNAWITFGLYQPIHTGSCVNGTDPAGSQTITDSVTLCVKLNTQAVGLLLSNGQLTINPASLSGYIIQTAQDPATPVACAATGTSWCKPSAVGSDRNIFYIVAALNTPGGIPPGQQSGLTSLNFYFNVASI